MSPWTMRDGTEVTIRPLRPEDEPLLVKFHETLSEQSVYMRYFHMVALTQRIAHDRLLRICYLDYDRELALVADYKHPETGEHEILGVARLSREPGTADAEFGVLVADSVQKLGLGAELVHRLVAIGREEKIRKITAEMLPDNYAMQKVCERLGFRLERLAEEGVVRAQIAL
jgi:acetyltransferase